MGTAAPELQAPAEAPPEATQAEENPSHRRWLRVSSTPLLATLVGVVLSAWLIPAFTHQWNDRQKARDVQASVVSEIVSATAKALNDAQIASDAQAWKTTRATVPSAANGWTAAAANHWSVATQRIKARLGIYFGASASERWTTMSNYVTSTLFYASGTGYAFDDVKARPGRLQDLVWEYGVHHTNMNELRQALLTEGDEVAGAVLAMHVRGYSTRWRDVAKDLFPFV
jgi:hypothetical protein